MMHTKWLVVMATCLTIALSAHACESMWICVDGINDCGIQFGGCYDLCHPENAPKPPPCEDDCHTRTVCVDAIHECETRFGGCLPDCRPLPLTKPPCPQTTSSITLVTTMKN
ncbi:hypothetical protein B0J13DRAFT_115289 [Dactylonectria estremocensis]|uniref:Uncharacterized protein n=1 Tax=Dactylonectria estremocensis TaxID=1079267 RepID=A0A9P9FE69_9HYPO|nr:hypothetical protein B0J13DRAFT_115289 [Dactylonectria estremocensis]